MSSDPTVHEHIAGAAASLEAVLVIRPGYCWLVENILIDKALVTTN
ncbi:MAG TPA: hypothetical protein VFY84_12565 [Jiangellales bacterium]|nr:hypothetical protein [Jiangellales bacterium]